MRAASGVAQSEGTQQSTLTKLRRRERLTFVRVERLRPEGAVEMFQRPICCHRKGFPDCGITLLG